MKVSEGTLGFSDVFFSLPKAFFRATFRFLVDFSHTLVTGNVQVQKFDGGTNWMKKYNIKL